ncbi:MAG: VTT domain-containing protein [Alphaproteobacteria bacterium]
MRLRLLGRGLVLITTLAAGGFLAKEVGLDHMVDAAWVDTHIRGQGVTGEALFLAVGAVATAIGVPRQVISFLAGYAFGFVLGTVLALGASVAGCVIAFNYSRLLGRDVLLARFPGRIRRIDDFLHDNPVSMALLIRLLPLGHNLTTNLVAGVSSVRAGGFFLGSAIGYLPQTAVFGLLGSGIQIDPVFRISVSVALFLASGVLGVWIYRRFRHGKALDDDEEKALDDEV